MCNMVTIVNNNIVNILTVVNNTVLYIDKLLR